MFSLPKLPSLQLRAPGFRNKKDFARCVVEGRTPGSVHIKALEKMVQKCLLAQGIEEKIRMAETNLELVAIVENIFPTREFQQVLKGLAKDFGKSEAISKIFKEKAKVKMDLEAEYEYVLRCLNLAILFAPVAGGSLAEKYALRAKYFFSNQDWKNCLKDVQLALNQGCSDKLQSALLDMGNHCAIWDQKTNQEISADTLELRSYRDNVVFQLPEARNKKIPVAIDGIQIKFDETKGRHLVTECYVAPGSPVIVEEPYAKVVGYLMRWNTKYCVTCLANVERGIPCPTCVFVTYCSEACLQKDLVEGHAFECPCLPFIHAKRMQTQLILAFKIICKTGPKNLHTSWLEEERNEGQDLTSLISGFNPMTGTYDSDSHYQIHRMKAHSNPIDLSSITWNAVSAIKALDYLTPFFKDYEQAEFKTYVASMFVRHSQAMLCNAVGLVADVKGIDSDHIRHADRKEIAVAAYTVISLMSHSCDPNVMRMNLPNGKMAIITNRALNPGDELLFSYGFSYLSNSLMYRRSILLKNYHFFCKCIPCTLDWPLRQNIGTTSTFLCPNCSDRYKNSLIDKIQKCSLPSPNSNNVTICTNCGHEGDVQQLMDKANEIEAAITQAQDLCDKKNKPIEAISMMRDSTAKIQSLICPPSKEAIRAQIVLRQLFEYITDA